MPSGVLISSAVKSSPNCAWKRSSGMVARARFLSGWKVQCSRSSTCRISARSAKSLMATNSCQVFSGNSKIDNGRLPAPGIMRSSGMPICRPSCLKRTWWRVLLHRHAAGQPLGVGRRRIGDRRLVEHLRAVELVDGVADHQLGDGLAIFLGRALQFLDGLDDDGVAHGGSPQTRGSVLKASRSVVRSVNLSGSLALRSWASVAGAPAFEPAQRAAAGRTGTPRGRARPATGR